MPYQRVGRIVCLAALVAALAACGGTGNASRMITLKTLNDSGVTGTAVLTDLGDGTTRVEVTVDPAGHPDMPAHIHPGTCSDLVPQPLYPLQNVVDGTSETVVAEPIDDLFDHDLALNIHTSNTDFATYTACAELVS
jgi:hypothetical protein